MRVMKFGGSSLATPERIRTVGSLVEEAARRERVLVVVSAVAGVTDLLLRWCSRAPEALPEEVGSLHGGLWDAVTDRTLHGEALPGMGELLEEGRELGKRAATLGGWDSATRDHALSLGERLSSRLLTAHLLSRGVQAVPVDGREVIRTDGAFGAAEVDLDATGILLRRLVDGLAPGAVPVLTGFIGGDGQGHRTTLGRGSSDYSAAVAAAAVGARVVEIWTDVDGVHREDPRAVPGTPLLPRLSWSEARALARNGAKVLHARTLDPLEGAGIPLHVRNTLRPEAPGTWVEGGVTTVTEGQPPGGGTGAPPGALLRVHLFLAGATGRVGRALLQQLEALTPSLLRDEGIQMVVGGAFGSRGQLWSREGIPPGRALGLPLPGPSPDWAEIPARMAAAAHAAPVFLDCTAHQVVAERYVEILEAGIPVVTPNKLAGSGPLAGLRRVREVARCRGTPFRAETSVGAALPILGTLTALQRSGDRIHAVTGVLSGTLAFLFVRLAQGVPFSRAVREARERGLTEPNPREDLTGADVARKLLILLRESGREAEMEEISVESLVPPGLPEIGSAEAFLSRLEEADALWVDRVAEATRRGERLAYVGSFDGSGAIAGVRAFPLGHPLAHLLPGENRVVVETDRYREVPLTIAGPGAGPEVTASGIVTDLLAAVAERYRERSAPGGRRVA